MGLQFCNHGVYANTVLAKQLSSKVCRWGGNALQGIPLVRCQRFPSLCQRSLLMSAPELANGLPADPAQLKARIISVGT